MGRSWPLPCQEDGAGPGPRQNPCRNPSSHGASSGKQSVCGARAGLVWSGASSRRAAAAGEGEASPGRILLVTGARRDAMAVMERDQRRLLRVGSLGCHFCTVASQFCDGSLKALIKNPPPSLRPGGGTKANGRGWSGWLWRASVPACASPAPGAVPVERRPLRQQPSKAVGCSRSPGAASVPPTSGLCRRCRDAGAGARRFLPRGARPFRRGDGRRGRALAPRQGWARSCRSPWTATLQGTRSSPRCQVGGDGGPSSSLSAAPAG